MIVQPIEIPPFKNLSPGDNITLSYDDAVNMNNWVLDTLAAGANVYNRWVEVLKEKAELKNENQRLRDALNNISETDTQPENLQYIAREALKEKP